ncbi:FecR domain-containing protein [uncultured Sphingomonas sp.]|uniref:FecR family protein n=1 Tax=uncultured Sphingomonas sp. TaxID=158754 RepID=UPI0025E17DAD|nr:FecR domain-containing protein [uncultured Sphingomonas sp.]
MTDKGADPMDQAIAWHLRLADAGVDDWATFVDWLEADPAHAAAYDRVAMQDRAVSPEHFPVAEAQAGNDNDPAAAPRHRWRWIAGGSAIAAGLAAVIVPQVLPQASAYEVATASGERRALTLEDGTRIELSGGTRLRLDRATPRLVALEQGEALFTVHHDAARPFVVTAAGRTVQDVGTVFNVAADDTALSVEVAEGSVLYEPEGAAVMLQVGDGLNVAAKSTTVRRTKLAPESVGGWRRGVLTFNERPLRDVAGALHRLYGFRIDLSPGLSDRPFTGMVRFSGTADRDVPHLADLIGATWRRDEGRWVLAEAPTR